MPRKKETPPEGPSAEPSAGFETPAAASPAEGGAPTTAPKSAAPQPPDDLQKIRDALYLLIKRHKLTRRDLDRAVGATRGTFANVLDGKVELKVRHIAQILGVLGLDMGPFFESVFGPSAIPGAGPLAARALQKIHQTGTPIPDRLPLPTANPNPQDLRRRIAERIDEAVALVLQYQLETAPLPRWEGDGERKDEDGGGSAP